MATVRIGIFLLVEESPARLLIRQTALICTSTLRSNVDFRDCPHAITLPDALVALSSLRLLQYPIDEKSGSHVAAMLVGALARGGLLLSEARRKGRACRWVFGFLHAAQP